MIGFFWSKSNLGHIAPYSWHKKHTLSSLKTAYSMCHAQSVARGLIFALIYKDLQSRLETQVHIFAPSKQAP